MTTLTIDEPPPSECLGLPLCDWRRKIGELFGLLSRAGVHGIVFEFAGYWKDVGFARIKYFQQFQHERPQV